jgi:FeS assembly SUF system protein
VTNPDEGSGQQAEPRTGESPAAEGAETIRGRVVDVLRTVYDPEIPVDIYELGLVYEVDVREDGVVFLRMTLTSPMCPVAESLPPEVEAKVRGVAGVKDVELELVWEPPWNPSMMSEAARLELGM